MTYEASNPALGHITCPTCGNPKATIHRTRGGSRKLYLRCYEENGAMICGTLQPGGPAGQHFLQENAEWFRMEQKDAAAQDAAHEAAEATRAAISEEARRTTAKRKAGFLNTLLRED